MPSASLQLWQKDRLSRLKEVDSQCSASMSLVPAQPTLVEENLRAYVLLLSAHFQGFCRDLYTECANIIASKVRPRLKFLILDQFSAQPQLDRGNPSPENLKKDFSRFGFKLNFESADPANSDRIFKLNKLINWRNVAAHHGNPPPNIVLDLVSVQDWLFSPVTDLRCPSTILCIMN